MVATAKSLRFQTKEIFETVGRGEEVLITYHGKPYAKLVPLKNRKKNKSKTNELFGIWKDNEVVKDVDTFVRNLRKRRF